VRQRSQKRSSLWCSEQLDFLRKRWIQRAGRLTRPAGRLTLTLGRNDTVRSSSAHYLAAEAQAPKSQTALLQRWGLHHSRGVPL
jgi:hypothetical protein